MSRTHKSTLVSQKHLNALKRAIDEAEGWRGQLIGNPDPGPLEEYDGFIAEARVALKSVRRLNREVRLERHRPTPQK
jgi:hypothetical protein